MFKKLARYLMAVMLVSAYVAAPAQAHQSPPGCNSNRLTLSLTRDKITIKQGEVLTYTVTLSNLDSGTNLACDIDNATVTVILPALDGTPTGQSITLATATSYPAGTSVTLVGTVPYTVNVNSGVTDAAAQANINGTLHDAPVDHTAEISKTIGTTIIYDPPSDDSNLPGMPNTAVVQ